MKDPFYLSKTGISVYSANVIFCIVMGKKPVCTTMGHLPDPVYVIKPLLFVIPRKEMKEWSQVMIERMKELKPLVACFNGKGIYEIFSGGKCTVGLQEQPLPGTETVSKEQFELCKLCLQRPTTS